ncbi:CotH kinase family protein [Crenothrix sp.]|uniref:CotH kinase family protein n=1 Tax=Crenothrix sp. TaxID=3100433 RepID=UPI00374DE72F
MSRFKLSSTLSWVLYGLLMLSASFTVAANKQPENVAQSKSAAPVKWLQHDLKLNNIGVGVESAHKILFVPLGKGFDKPANYDVKLSYKQVAGYTFVIKGKSIKNGSRFRLNGIKYGAKIPLQRYRNGRLLDTYTLLFTNLPVLQLTAAKIVDETKSPGTFRLLSGQFKQDTGVHKMGIEFRGSELSQTLPKKSLDVEIAKATNWTKGDDIKLLDLNKDSDWILDCVHDADSSFHRNLVSHDIFRAIRPGAYRDKLGVAHGQASLRGHLTEVIKNGAYDGVYVLNEKPGRKMYDLKKISVPVDANGKQQWGKVNFKNLENGSVLYKANIDEDTLFFESRSVKNNFVQVYPKPKDVKRFEPLVEFADFVAKANDKTFATGIAKRIDLDSVVDWWALVLVSHAEDNIRHNFMLAKSGSGKFYMLSWDHDGSFGVNWFAFEPNTNNLIRRLTKIPATGFNKKLKARWKKLRATEFRQAKMVSRFKGYIDESNKAGAKARNTARWRWPVDEAGVAMGTAKYINSYLAGWLPQADKIIRDLPEK